MLINTVENVKQIYLFDRSIDADWVFGLNTEHNTVSHLHCRHLHQCPIHRLLYTCFCAYPSFSFCDDDYDDAWMMILPSNSCLSVRFS